MENRIRKVESRISYIKDMSNFAVIGDPGCDGLGTYNMKVYADAVRECNDSDFILVVGDLVPTGTDEYYRLISELTNECAKVPVYVLPGNHDTGDYNKYFGLSNYALISGTKALIVMDNKLRAFDKEGIELLEEVLSLPEVNDAWVAFHIPLPNSFTGNSVSQGEADLVYNAIKDNIDKVRCFICGHVHSRFEDTIWGIPMICTGGGGAFLEDVSESIKATDVYHHYVKFDERGRFKIHDIGSTPDANEDEAIECIQGTALRPAIQNPILLSRLEESVKDELMAHLQYMVYADDAEKRGLNATATLFRALASSEYHHARNFFSLLQSGYDPQKKLDSFINVETFEYKNIYKMLVDYCNEMEHVLGKTAYKNAMDAERIHADILKKVDPKEEYSGKDIYVCPVCGFLMEGEGAPERCPVCGRPSKVFEEYHIQ